MCFPHERHHVMFAVAVDFDVLQEDEFVITFDLCESPLQWFKRVGAVAPEVLMHRPDNPRRCVEQSLAIGILADEAEQGTNMRHGLFRFGCREIRFLHGGEIVARRGSARGSLSRWKSPYGARMERTSSSPPRAYHRANVIDGPRWIGRDDGGAPEVARWHQRVCFADLADAVPPCTQSTACFIGYASDLGVRMNQGRAGAADGPHALRERMSNLPSITGLRLVDCGDIVASDSVLATQEALAWAVERIAKSGALPIILGGGHDQAFGHFLGLARALGHAPACLNFDAHADLRPIPASGPNSGTPFTQASEWCSANGEQFRYAIVGWQDCANTQLLTTRAKERGVLSVAASEVDRERVKQVTDSFSGLPIALSIDLDVFAAAYAPGVSAPTALGIVPDAAFTVMLRELFAPHGADIRGIEIAELCPALDVDGHTARLGAALLFTLLSAYAQSRSPA